MTTTANNVSNCFGIFPFYEEEKKMVLMDANYLETLSSQTIHKIEQKLFSRQMVLKAETKFPFPYPHDEKKSSTSICLEIHHILIHEFNFENWAPLFFKPNQYIIYKFQPNELKIIEEIANLRLLTDKKLKKEDGDCLKNINLQTAPYFVKLSLTSGKNDRPIQPCYDHLDIMNALTSSRIMVNDLKNSSLILQPWKSYLKRENEWRLFIKNKELRAISQQYTNLSLRMNDVNLVLELMKNFWLNEIKPIIQKTNWLSECTLDIHVNPEEKKEEKKVELIEVNPYICSGSALFHWLIPSDFDLLLKFNYVGKRKLRYKEDNKVVELSF